MRIMVEKRTKIIVTIDGPAASGKSTTARMVAKRLGWLYLDTGAMYRALTVKVLQEHIALDDKEKISELAAAVNIELTPSGNGVRVLLDGRDITSEIRHPDVDRAVGPVCEISQVREIMVTLQQKIARGRIIAEGRDMGTVVFPDADLKFFIVASLEERAKRRQKDIAKQGIEISVENLMDQINERDHRDSTRENSPLVKAEDAILLNTTTLTVEKQINFVLEHIHQVLRNQRMSA